MTLGITAMQNKLFFLLAISVKDKPTRNTRKKKTGKWHVSDVQAKHTYQQWSKIILNDLPYENTRDMVLYISKR